MNIIIPFLLILLCLFLIYKIFFEQSKIFRYDSKNPYRRYCKKCGQQQDQFTYSFSHRITWWEDIGEIHDEKCKCHKYSRYCSF